MNRLSDRSEEIILFDGGVGHELKLRLEGTSFLSGAKACIENPDIVEAVHEAFYQSIESVGWDGEIVATTNSFVATPYHWRDEQDKDGWIEHVRAAAKCAKGAAKKSIKTNRLVAGCLPPLGECYSTPNEPKEKLEEWYTQIIEALGEVDILLAETLSSSVEAEAAIAAAMHKQQNCHVRIGCCFTLADDTNCRLRSGEWLEVAAARVMSTGKISFLGVNCCSVLATDAAIDLLSDIIASHDPSCKLLVYTNAFARSTSDWLASIDRADAQTKAAHLAEFCGYSTGISPQIYAKHIINWYVRGATAFGGCCGTTPIHMHAIANSLISFSTDDKCQKKNSVAIDVLKLLDPLTRTYHKAWRVFSRRRWRPRTYPVLFTDSSTLRRSLESIINLIDDDADMSLVSRVQEHITLRFNTEACASSRLGASLIGIRKFDAAYLDAFASDQINSLAVSFTKKPDDCDDDDENVDSSRQKQATSFTIRLPTTALVLVYAYIHDDLTPFAGNYFHYLRYSDSAVTISGVGVITREGCAVGIERTIYNII
uniref:Hcy-binding domain-containing protein n=1 Tax=Aureoumbra lagunensis TaxID=44058 RepID=A0A7S3JQ91_9STRA|mmetsp:Transcript_8733/g.13444  ORF Transcript_8733/g.13444 Transcript_8733/m.13444 type:complete len:541 (-) Transcript_8733:104-1726(-)|eukprot:CAMPEP_0197318948 /NCGR_PEP_ID=MMETSP0891-20130614/52777_1 /TAXON_ID=44058 ORGANISM="Aureoumbra lagunensis, Strain CCMP1510" /NCGR_SAMPLE_ID=MMETSP0891 /ASSEMBLY_ACC=CAM_ASM_000534 /LENGTH=540 /DNA_ID=CAMNT_0042809605 /DNA_START=1291 /DNA_END=2913 /DNA_ORIENTATION=+